VGYQSLLVERRERLHERTAQAIEELYSDALDAHYGELAYHYGRTENTSKAVQYLHLAGEQAVQRSAYAEAIDQLTRAVELVATLPGTRERSERELLLQLTLGGALSATQGFGAAEAERAYARARDLSEEVGEVSQVFRALVGLFDIHMMRAEFDRMGDLAEQLLRLARGTGDQAHLLLAHGSKGDICFYRGEFCLAREHLEEAIRRYNLQEFRSHEYLFSEVDSGVWAIGDMSWTLWNLGYPDQALTRSREVLGLAQELSHPFSQTYALFSANQLHGLRREWQAALEGAEALIALSSEHGFLQFVGMGTFQRAWALTDQGQLQEGIAGIRAVLEAMRAADAVLGSSMMLAVLAEAQGRAGQAEEGLTLIEEAQSFVAKTGERVCEAEVHRVNGELLLAQSPSDQAGAEASLRRALDVAHCQSTKSLELRAATSLARLWQRQDRREEARKLLAPVYNWFTEGFDTADLKDAKALLDQLS
jgi:predicted ATPase